MIIIINFFILISSINNSSFLCIVIFKKMNKNIERKMSKRKNSESISGSLLIPLFIKKYEIKLIMHVLKKIRLDIFFVLFIKETKKIEKFSISKKQQI